MKREMIITNERGLHARAAAKFVKCVEAYDAEVVVTKDDNQVSGGSIMGLMMLAASTGTIIEIEASGKESAEALNALATLVDGKFGEK
ncbi:HPr family phosphocarrier protein [Sneathiella sp.]|uniref:HPr family phosphocarrier protein n=1 Tax=Sneathiella sp. TaxID=1964365 RepID=UPI003FA6890E